MRPVGNRVASHLVLVIALLAASATWVVFSSGSARADASATTVAGNVAWNDRTGAPFAGRSTVTVDQSANIVSQVVHVSWKNFSPTQNANTDAVRYPVRVYECTGSAVTSLAACFSTPGYQAQHPDATNIEANTNVVNTSTGSDGTGGIDFAVLTAADEPTLGCDATHPCSIVVEPDFGGNSIGSQCTDHSNDALWSTISGSFWGKDASCSWQNRIVIPLEFEPTPNDCPSAHGPDFDTEGAPLLARALDGWRQALCQNTAGGSGVLVGYSELGENQARTDFQAGSVDVALTNYPTSATTSRRYTYAPISISGISIAYYVDDPTTHQPILGMKLNARLLAKMLTQSYPGIFASCSSGAFYPCASEDAGNPASVFADPEFKALNPGFRALASYSDDGNSSPTVVFGDSDLSTQLTSWIAADPDAAAFLNGQSDPWGMHVNSYYLPGTSPRYPISQFTANDPGATKKAKYNCGRQGDNTVTCVTQGIQSSWFPVSGVHNAAKLLLSGKVTAKVPSASCPGGVGITNETCDQHAGAPTMALGTRAAFAVVSQADAAAYRFPVAELQTQAGTFVGPTTQSMSSALTSMVTDADKITQRLDYTKPIDPRAYPLTSVSYAMVPTCGESSAKAALIARSLRYITSDGAQVYGSAPGQLTQGYVTLTSAMRTQTEAAAQAVQAQTCPVNPAPTKGIGFTSPTPATPAPTVPSNTGALPGSTSAGIPPAGSGPAPSSSAAERPGSSSAGTTPSSSSATNLQTTPVSFGRPNTASAGMTGLIVPIVLLVTALLILGGPAAYLLGRTGVGAVAWHRVRHLWPRR